MLGLNMKRDMELVRKILLAMESEEHGYARNTIQQLLPEATKDTIGFHCSLMNQAGLIMAIDTTARGAKSPCARPMSITWSGYEFLETIRDDGVWKEVKKRLAKAGSFASPIIKQLGIEMIKQQVGLSD